MLTLKLMGFVLAIVAEIGTTVAQEAQVKNSSRVGPDGTAYVTRVVPVPTTISPEARKEMARVVSDTPVTMTMEQSRNGTDAWQARAGEVAKRLYPANVEAGTVAGVPCDLSLR